MRRTKRFDDGGLASSGSQSAFGQQRSAYPAAPGGLGNNAPLVQIGTTAPAQAASSGLFGQSAQQTQPMKRGGKVKAKATFAKGGKVRKYAVGGAMTPPPPAPKPLVPAPNPQTMSAKPLPTQVNANPSVASAVPAQRIPRPPLAHPVRAGNTSPNYVPPVSPVTKARMAANTEKQATQDLYRQQQLDLYRKKQLQEWAAKNQDTKNPMPVLDSQRMTPEGKAQWDAMTPEQKTKYLTALDYGQDISGYGKQRAYRPIEPDNYYQLLSKSVGNELTPITQEQAAKLAKLDAERQSINSGQTVTSGFYPNNNSQPRTPEEEAAAYAAMQQAVAAFRAQNPTAMKKGGAVKAKAYKKGGEVAMKKGGSAKGWGKARGARAAKIV